MKQITIALIVIILLALGGWYYFSYQTPAVIPLDTTTGTDMETPSPSNTSTTTGSMETGTIGVEVTVTPANQKKFTVSGFNFGFSPTTLTVKKGDHVKITFTNSGGMHDFKIDEFAVATPRINSGQEAVVEFDATKAGTFQFYCSVGNHRAMGMFGTLVVE